MESNKDEALRCLVIARKHHEAGNVPSARKFCQKSIALFETQQALQLLATINASPSSSSGASAPQSTSSAAEEHPSAAGTKRRHAERSTSSNGTSGGIGGEKREYTTEQGEVVRRVRACKVTDYYEILALKRDCEDADVKKAYRKLALALHPDKNGAPGADEAFKSVSKAFQILSDPQKRAAFDRSGGDPEDRFGGMSNGQTFATSPFGEDVSAEEIFRMFFGGAGGPGFGASFGGGPVFTTTFGPGGFTTTRMGGQHHRQGNGNTEPRSMLIQLLPLLILFAFSLLSALPSLFGSAPVADPRFSFQRTSRYNVERQTGNLGVNYHVNSAEFMAHPVIGAELARDGVDVGKVEKVDEKAAKGKVKKQKRGPALHKFEHTIERVYTQELYGQCQRGVDRKERLKEQEIGLFGIGTDWEKVKKIEQEVVESCEELRRLGVLAR